MATFSGLSSAATTAAARRGAVAGAKRLGLRPLPASPELPTAKMEIMLSSLHSLDCVRLSKKEGADVALSPANVNEVFRWEEKAEHRPFFL